MDGEHYDRIEGKDKHGGKYNIYGQYIPGDNFDSNLRIYESEKIKDSNYQEKMYLQKVEDSEKYKINKLKEEYIENKDLLNKYGQPYKKEPKFEDFDYGICFSDDEETEKDSKAKSENGSKENLNQIEKYIEVKGILAKYTLNEQDSIEAIKDIVWLLDKANTKI